MLSTGEPGEGGADSLGTWGWQPGPVGGGLCSDLTDTQSPECVRLPGFGCGTIFLPPEVWQWEVL